MSSKIVCGSSASGFGASAASPFPVKSSSYAEPNSDGGFCCSESEMESGGVKAPSDKGTSARAVPSRCRRWADMFVLLNSKYSDELEELEGLDGLVLRLDRLLLLPGKAGIAVAGDALRLTPFLRGPLVSSHGVESECSAE